MKKHFAYGLVALSIFVVLPGCAIEDPGGEEEISQDEVAVQDLETQVMPNRCVQPIVTGPCRARFLRFAFDATTGRCVRFTYGGCQGNTNNFTSWTACRRACR